MDTYINGEYPGETRGSYAFLYVGEDEKAYIYTPTPELPVLGTLSEAKLSVWYYYFDKIKSGYLSATAHQVDGMTWAEGSLTWNAAINYLDEGESEERFGLKPEQLGGRITMSGSIGAYKETPVKAQFNVTAAVADWINNSGTNYGVGSNYGIGLKYDKNNSTNRSVRLYSTEGSGTYQPQLEYTYSVPYSIENLEEVDLYLYYDHAYGNRYSDASDRIEREAKELQEFFLEEFDIMINYTSAASFYSSADACTSDYDGGCECKDENGDDVVCQNATTYVDTSGNVISDFCKYHHTNIYNIFCRLPEPNNSTSVTMSYIGHETCETYASYDNTCGPSITNGLSLFGAGTMLINNFISETSETITAIHEMGHMFGIPDHYGNGHPTTEDMQEIDEAYNRNCIYGEARISMTSIENIVICQGCRNVIEKNRGIYSE